MHQLRTWPAILWDSNRLQIIWLGVWTTVRSALRRLLQQLLIFFSNSGRSRYLNLSCTLILALIFVSSLSSSDALLMAKKLVSALSTYYYHEAVTRKKKHQKKLKQSKLSKSRRSAAALSSSGSSDSDDYDVPDVLSADIALTAQSSTMLTIRSENRFIPHNRSSKLHSVVLTTLDVLED
jgi:hypothetical protein